jgi:histidinol-phosphate phosphatase family protein
MKPALFLDRDGVIIENKPAYVRRLEDVSFYPQALEAFFKLRSCPYKIIMVTNQSCISRGIVTLEMARAINQQVVHHIEQIGGRIDDLFMCPHSPLDGCSCRKPQPGLLLQAAHKHAIDLPNSFMIGDALSDIKAGQRAGIARTILVSTGRGAAQALLPERESLLPFPEYPTLLEACIDLFSHEHWWDS